MAVRLEGTVTSCTLGQERTSRRTEGYQVEYADGREWSISSGNQAITGDLDELSGWGAGLERVFASWGGWNK